MSTKATPHLPDFFVYVLVPLIQTDDSTIAYYNDFSQSIDEFTKAFGTLQVAWKWQPVTMQDYRSVIDAIAADGINRKVAILNLCDGDEINGSPGLSVIDHLEQANVVYTGADHHFYHITTSKISMKHAFDRASVSNASWFAISSPTYTLNGEFHSMAKPIIVKPAVSAGSIGLGVKNVVHTETELTNLVSELYKDYHGWNLAAGGFVAEAFISGREFTSFIVGSGGSEKVYPPVERVFHKDLPDLEKFLSFDRLWEFYDGEKPIGDYEDFYNYHPVESGLTEQINALSVDAYRAVGGTGYGRIDIRQDQKTGKLYTLEVNAQCGLSEDENYTSIGAILRYAKEAYHQVVSNILQDAIYRHEQKQLFKNRQEQQA